MSEPQGPYLTLAVLCERVLQEKDDAISLIRLIDRFVIALPALTADGTFESPALISFSIVVGLRSESAGEHEIVITLKNPDGTTLGSGTGTVVLQGGGHGANLATKLDVAIARPGAYWFEVGVAERVLSRVPLQVVAAGH
jgi:hypothetical protein